MSVIRTPVLSWISGLASPWPTNGRSQDKTPISCRPSFQRSFGPEWSHIQQELPTSGAEVHMNDQLPDLVATQGGGAQETERGSILWLLAVQIDVAVGDVCVQPPPCRGPLERNVTDYQPTPSLLSCPVGCPCRRQFQCNPAWITSGSQKP